NNIANSNNKTIWIYDQNDQRCLTFQNPYFTKNKQTCIYRDSLHKPVFKYFKMILSGLYIQSEPKKALVLGLGGGGIVHSLKFLFPDLHIDIVELDSAIIKISKEYFYIQESDKLKLYNQNALDYATYANRQKLQYDFIISDTFDEKYIPKELLTENYILKLKSLLTEKGVLVVNTFRSSVTYKMETDLVLNCFGEFYNLVDANRIIIASKQRPLPSISEIENKAKKWHNIFESIGINDDFLLKKFHLLSQF
ncbi:MAG: fused MFS/spermidine synthase, partial [Rickettsiaceae bacterium]|nr:fused MFS/spermidine synthase [Rickettsiaceae bacterium]